MNFELLRTLNNNLQYLSANLRCINKSSQFLSFNFMLANIAYIIGLPIPKTYVTTMITVIKTFCGNINRYFHINKFNLANDYQSYLFILKFVHERNSIFCNVENNILNMLINPNITFQWQNSSGSGTQLHYLHRMKTVPSVQNQLQFTFRSRLQSSQRTYAV